MLTNLFPWVSVSFYSSKEDLDGSFHFCLCLCWQLYQWELQKISQPGKGRKWHLYIPNYPSFQQLAPFSAVLNYSLLFPSLPVAAYCLSKIQSSLSSILSNSPFALSCSMLKPKLLFLFLGSKGKHRVIFCSLEAFIIFLVECSPVIRSRMWIVLPKYHGIKLISTV